MTQHDCNIGPGRHVRGKGLVPGGWRGSWAGYTVFKEKSTTSSGSTGASVAAASMGISVTMRPDGAHLGGKVPTQGKGEAAMMSGSTSGTLELGAKGAESDQATAGDSPEAGSRTAILAPHRREHYREVRVTASECLTFEVNMTTTVKTPPRSQSPCRSGRSRSLTPPPISSRAYLMKKN